MARSRLRNWLKAARAATQSATGGKVVSSPQDLEAAIRAVSFGSSAGAIVTPESAMRVAAVYGCVRVITGAVANLPLHIKRRVDEKTRLDATDHPLWALLTKKPNPWQTPSQLRRMLQAHLLLRGNAYVLIARSMGKPVALIPLHPDRVEVFQGNDLKLEFKYTRPNGSILLLNQSQVMHLVGLTLDGVNGVSVIKYARDTIGLSMAQEHHGATTFKNSARPSSVLTHPGNLGNEAIENLRASLDAYRSGGDSEGQALILEEGMKVEPLSMTSEDAQWIESRKVSRTDIAMFFGVPPHMIGDTEKSTSWGTGIEQQSIGFVTYTLEDHLTTWEQSIDRDLITETDLYARFNRRALVRGDIKTRKDFYTMMLTWGVYSPNEVRALEDENPREGGDVYYPPPNTAGTTTDKPEGANEPE